jgi:hypothetical protein
MPAESPSTPGTFPRVAVSCDAVVDAPVVEPGDKLVRSSCASPSSPNTSATRQTIERGRQTAAKQPWPRQAIRAQRLQEGRCPTDIRRLPRLRPASRAAARQQVGKWSAVGLEDPRAVVGDQSALGVEQGARDLHAAIRRREGAVVEDPAERVGTAAREAGQRLGKSCGRQPERLCKVLDRRPTLIAPCASACRKSANWRATPAIRASKIVQAMPPGWASTARAASE